MSDRPDIDERLGELLRSEAPVPEHAEGYRERVAALLTAESVARTGRNRWWPGRSWQWVRPVREESVVVRRVPREPARSHRRGLVGALAFLLLLLVVAWGTLEPLERLLNPTMVLRITDETIVDAEDPAATRTTVVATTLVSLDETKEFIHGLIEAINAGDASAVGTFYATNGWLENDVGETSIQGSVRIADYWSDARERLGLRLEAAGDPLPHDRYVAQPVRYLLPDERDARTGVLVFQIDASGHIAHLWVTGWVEE
jgi:hypothetical protein